MLIFAKMNTPRFSIITVTYNAASTIPATLKSVDAQSCRDFEHIIVDGSSADTTIDICKAHGAVVHPKNDADNVAQRTYVSEPDGGLYDAMNKGIGLARGEYLIFLNAGDAFHSSDTLAHLSAVIDSNDTPGIVYGQTQLVDAEGRRIADRHLSAPEVLTYDSFSDGMLVCHQAFTVLKRIAPLYNLNYRYSADYDWCIQCLQHSRHNVYVPEITIDYLSEGLTTANHRASLRERFHIMCFYYGTWRTIKKHLGFIPRYLAHKRKLKKHSTT